MLLTDPPYGLGIAARGSIGSGRRFTPKDWDVVPPRAYFEQMLRVSEHQIIWGGNYFTPLLPASRCWLVWYKKDGLPRNSFADCELAWTSFRKNALVFNSRWSGFVKDSREPRVAHPTQKALAVMKWCVKEFSREGDVILDPFLGSGTTAVAAKLLRRNFIGIEIDHEYVAIARERLKQAAWIRSTTSWAGGRETAAIRAGYGLVSLIVISFGSRSCTGTGRCPRPFSLRARGARTVATARRRTG